MRIGIFTDFYHPSINGISFIVDIMREQFEELGEEVFIFAPMPGVRGSYVRLRDNDDPNIFRFSAIKGLFFDEYRASVFYPPRELRRIAELDLDIICIMTPGQIGLLGVAAAVKSDIPLVSYYWTDLFEYVRHYPTVLPGLLALSATVPFILPLSPHVLRKVTAALRPHSRVTDWNNKIIHDLVTLVHNHCDDVIVPSPKTMAQLQSWGTTSPMHLVPIGVDALSRASAAQVTAFREKWGLSKTDEVVLYVGRISAEKNLDLIVEAFQKVAAQRQNAKLLFVGDFDYRKELEDKAHETRYADRIIFTGAIRRQDLDVAYAVGTVFAFPSLTDTQGVVLHEAAHRGLPIVWCDKQLNSILHDGVNGYLASPTANGFAQALLAVLTDNEKRTQQGKASRKLAKTMTEKKQAKVLLERFDEVIALRR